MSQHLIIIHLDSKTKYKFENEVYDIVKTYNFVTNNIVIVKFGTIIYTTDSISRINLQIMDWLIHDMKYVQYDYHITLGGAVYPLHNATTISQMLYYENENANKNKTKKNVWLGKMKQRGKNKNRQWSILTNKRLISTSTKIHTEIGQILPARFFKHHHPVPDWIRQIMIYKSYSGNQAIFSREVVQKLVTNPKVKELFQIAKYGCCCCLEERVWIAALNIIGYLDDAISNNVPAMFQLWGGDYAETKSDCHGTMHNALLDLNSTLCYVNEIGLGGYNHNKYNVNNSNPLTTGGATTNNNNNNSNKDLYIYGNELWDEIVQAKKHGIFFARKFKTNHNADLVQKIHDELHHW